MQGSYNLPRIELWTAPALRSCIKYKANRALTLGLYLMTDAPAHNASFAHWLIRRGIACSGGRSLVYSVAWLWRGRATLRRVPCNSLGAPDQLRPNLLCPLINQYISK
jgi:hypothetical protein